MCPLQSYNQNQCKTNKQARSIHSDCDLILSYVTAINKRTILS